MHGNNCVGNNGKDNKVPVIGDNCDLGFGSIVIGQVILGDDCTVGANAVVTKSFDSNSMIKGVPGNAK